MDSTKKEQLMIVMASLVVVVPAIMLTSTRVFGLNEWLGVAVVGALCGLIGAYGWAALSATPICH